MIYFVEGHIDVKDPAFLVINVGGMGYEVKISLTTYAYVKELTECKLFTYFHVKEDTQASFGFYQMSEKEIFTSLISVNGVGATTAMMILSTLSPDEISSAIQNNDVNTIKSVKGIGLKTAQRLVLELRDKVLISSSEDSSNISGNTYNSIKSESLSALVTLGIPKMQAEKAIDKIMKEKDTELKVEQIIRLVLKSY